MNLNRRHKLSQIGKERAKNSACSACSRQNAMQTIVNDPMVVVKRCRWCEHQVERAGYLFTREREHG